MLGLHVRWATPLYLATQAETLLTHLCYLAAVLIFKRCRERQRLASQNNSVSVGWHVVGEHPLLPEERLLCFAQTKSDIPTLQNTHDLQGWVLKRLRYRASLNQTYCSMHKSIWQNFALMEALLTMDSTLKFDLSCRITQSTSAFRRL